MKLIYKKTILQKINDLINEARLEKEKRFNDLEHILLTRTEALDLYHATSDGRFFVFPSAILLRTLAMTDEERIKSIHGALIFGVTIKVEGEK